ncbi:MAG: 3-deoxy-7-phosphoheptulonate synthase, partial [Desulfobacterales bacterium]
MKTYDVNVKEFIPLISPHALKDDMPITPEAARTVISGRRVIQDIIGKKDRRLLVIAGPCSIHDEAAALEYADRLNRLKEKVNET